MAAVKSDTSIAEFQAFIKEVYGLANARFFSVSDMLTNIQRFLMRGIKGIRKGNNDKVVKNLIISSSWFMSLMNQYGINIEEEVWKRFPYRCSYCGTLPCSCKAAKTSERRQAVIDQTKQPKTLKDFQKMLAEIYPPTGRTLEHAGIHLAEEMGELAEAFWVFQSTHADADLANIVLEAADLVSCYLGVFNSMNIDFADELAKEFVSNCGSCKQCPCVCPFDRIAAFKS